VKQAVHTKTPGNWKLVKISTATSAALVNADSIALFVQQLAGYRRCAMQVIEEKENTC
jgi:hypothetical protein